jgi:allantoicase
LTILSRGFSPIIRYFVESSRNKAELRSLRIGSTKVVASEPQIGSDGLVTGIKSAVFLKRKYVPDGHVMLGDESERKEFENYPYFVNLEKYGDPSGYKQHQ